MTGCGWADYLAALADALVGRAVFLRVTRLRVTVVACSNWDTCGQVSP